MVFSPYSLLAATRVKKERLGIALVGLGYYSNDLLAPALQQTKNCYLAGIVSGTPSKVEVGKSKAHDHWRVDLGADTSVRIQARSSSGLHGL